MKQTFALLLSILLATPTSVSAAPSRAKVLVGEVSLPPADFASRVQIRASVRNSFGREGRVELIRDEEYSNWKKRVAGPKSTPNPTADLRKAREALAKGRKLYDALKFKEAVTALEESRREFIVHLPSLRSNRELIDAHLYLGVTYLALKQEAKAKGELARVVYLDPMRELSSRDYAPQVRQLFAKVRQEVMAEDPVRIRIEADPEDGVAYLNGRQLGRTPVQLELQPGEYFILVEKEGLRPWYQPVNLSQRLEIVRAHLQPLEDEVYLSRLFGVREGGNQGEAMERVVQAAKTVGADIVFLGSLESAGGYRMLGQLYDVRTADFSKVAVVSVGKDLSQIGDVTDDLVEALMDLIRKDGYVASAVGPDLQGIGTDMTIGKDDRPKGETVAQPKDKAWYERWWVYPILAGIGVGAFLGARAFDDGGNSSKVLINNKGNF